MFRHRSATPAGVAGNGEVRSLGNNVTSIYGSVVKARADTTTASTKAVGGQQSGVRSTHQQIRCQERMALGLGVTSYGLTSYELLFFAQINRCTYIKYRIELRNTGFRVQ